MSSPPAFSNDAKRLLVCTGNTVSVFSTSTGLQMGSLEGHVALVTSVIVVPAPSPAGRILCYCWTASLDGTIRYWDFSTPELMKTVDVRLPIFSMVIPLLLSQKNESSEKASDVFAYISVENIRAQETQPKALRGQVRKCNLTKSSLAGGVTLKETKKPEYITISSSGEFFGIFDKQKLHIWKVPEIESERVVLKRIDLHHTKKFTVFAFHPTQRIVAAGDVTGRILIWRGFGKRTFSMGDGQANGRSTNFDEDKPGVRGNDDADNCSTWHWHPHEVNCLVFSSDGAYIYSGGREGVLVVWQIDTGKKKFLPRIGSPLLYFVDSPDPSLASISCADNQIHLLKMPAMEMLKSISGIKLPFSPPEAVSSLCSGCVFDQKAGVVALHTENYGIQFYSLFDDHAISEVQVCERNHQPGNEITVVVTQLALSVDGSFMSTVEVRLPEEDIGGLVCLKFWTSDSQDKHFRLLTVIYEPHRDSDISAVAFRPTQLMAVTSSFGGDFKTWVCGNEIQKGEVQNTGWTCYAVGSYKKRPMTAATFSADGSVLAVAAETVITLWDPDRNILVAIIGDAFTPIKTLSFLGQSGYIVSASRGSRPQLSVWSLSKLSKLWSYSLQIEAVTCLGDPSTFAVLTLLPKLATESQGMALGGRDGAILAFDVNKPDPMAVWSVRKAEGGALAFLQGSPSRENFTQGKTSRGLLAFVNGDHEYVLFDPYSDEATEHGVAHRKGLVSEETEKYGYSSVYGELQEFNHERNQTAEIIIAPSEKPWATLFSGSSQTLPPLTKLCSAFLESLLEKRTAVVE